ncbi:MAG TPA: M23 family metallopeptidase [Bellilinea sp.]|nr:M23 family metallopeptidase [Bellilinea sp.]
MSNIPDQDPLLPDPTTESTRHEPDPEVKPVFLSFWEKLNLLGLSDTALKIGTGVISISLLFVVIWVLNTVFAGSGVKVSTTPGAGGEFTPVPTVQLPVLAPGTNNNVVDAIEREIELHTNLPSRPRFDFMEYTVQKNDSLYGIADKFNLKAPSIVWSNPKVIYDPHVIQPGLVIQIPPEDGAVYEWHAGDGLNKVSEFFKVEPEAIINWPSNGLSPETIGDYAAPNIEPGKMLFIPGGAGESLSGGLEKIDRTDPAVAKSYGPGWCGPISSGVIAPSVSFIWPTDSRWLSGYHYHPAIGHAAIDIGDAEGVPIYASNTGVVVYAGWNNRGYGNLIVLDHGNGWQTYYAHLSAYYVGCGQNISQAAVIGALGNTGNSSGPHLHFEIRSDTYGKVNPLDYMGP